MRHYIVIEFLSVLAVFVFAVPKYVGPILAQHAVLINFIYYYFYIRVYNVFRFG